MELPDLGKLCSWQQCNQLDFLPFTCENCRQVFCKEHYLTSAHDCKCLNEFFKKPMMAEQSVFHSCTQKNCSSRSALELLCSYCNRHFCVSHRYHDCYGDLTSSERKKQVKQWKKPKEQFRAAKEEADRKVEQALRKAEATPLQPLAQKVRLMKLKNKAIGENKIPSNDRLYFGVSPPYIDEKTDYKPSPLFTSKQWSVGRTIDLFSKKLQVINKNNEINEPKLRLFKLSDGSLIAKTADTVMENIIGTVIQNGDSLILDYVKEDDLNENVTIDDDKLLKYRSAAV